MLNFGGVPVPWILWEWTNNKRSRRPSRPQGLLSGWNTWPQRWPTANSATAHVKNPWLTLSMKSWLVHMSRAKKVFHASLCWLMRLRKLDLRTILVWPPPFLPHEGQVCSVAQMDPYCCFPFWFSLQQFFAPSRRSLPQKGNKKEAWGDTWAMKINMIVRVYRGLYYPVMRGF